ncbi:DsrE family protein [Erythrobacter sp. HL-111]|uniref:DsrE family protein n=1 Tax=Erythrobacter sp. HL-111 TaxID=1798193 RepID=UPI0006D968FB|nr:DsrE family protein [Erythrobacter sp. HL-111]KPP94318.1 MAG: DsrE/DsrF-like family [Erythrobacteraceae bacterium HL-111]SDS50284.1 DsrE/DsrF-like family protein [Erythrobacter sp. HL-111]
MRTRAGIAALAICMAVPVAAQDMSAFKTGPVIEDFGPHAPVPGVERLPADAEFAVAFDVNEPAGEGGANRGFMAAARFLNMHVANGVPEENIRLVVVVHGKASEELLNAEANPSRALVEALLEKDVRFVLCGQSAVAYGIAPEDLITGVEMSLSAMTAHAVLQQRGYTVNPF